MAERRKTPWRQGSIIPSDIAIALQLFGEEEASRKVAAVISHDCDLAQATEQEPWVEVIVGTRVAGANGNYTHAKTARRLQLYFEEGGKEAIVELHAVGKTKVLKERLIGQTPVEDFHLDWKQQTVLQTWLAARYRRAAFPDEFERRLKAAKLHETIAKILKPFADDIIAIFFDIDRGQSEVERVGPDDIYTLSISLLYSTARDSATATAEKAALLITSAFNKAFFIPGKNIWQNIELLECEPISDEAMTYGMSVLMKKWNLDHMSLRETLESAMVA